VQCRHRSRRTLELVRVHGAGIGERNDRPVHALAQAPGDDADDALMPARVVDADAEAVGTSMR
jgi:hypothetical protein